MNNINIGFLMNKKGFKIATIILLITTILGATLSTVFGIFWLSTSTNQQCPQCNSLVTIGFDNSTAWNIYSEEDIRNVTLHSMMGISIVGTDHILTAEDINKTFTGGFEPMEGIMLSMGILGLNTTEFESFSMCIVGNSFFLGNFQLDIGFSNGTIDSYTNDLGNVLYDPYINLTNYEDIYNKLYIGYCKTLTYIITDFSFSGGNYLNITINWSITPFS